MHFLKQSLGEFEDREKHFYKCNLKKVIFFQSSLFSLAREYHLSHFFLDVNTHSAVTTDAIVFARKLHYNFDFIRINVLNHNPRPI